MALAHAVLSGKRWLLCLFILFQLGTTWVSAQSVTIHGQIFSKSTGIAIAGAMIFVSDTAAIIADANGKYLFTIPPQDSIQLEFSSEGYKKLTSMLSLKNKKHITLDVFLEDESLALHEVEIVASKIRKKGTEGQSTEILKQQQIDQTASTNLKEGLQMVTGVSILDNEINIRGSSGYNYGTGSRVLVLLDGMPAMNIQQATVNFNLLPADNIDHVDVLKGSSELRYGSGALGGVVNVVMNEPSDRPFTVLRFTQRFYLPPPAILDNHWEGPQNSYISSLHFSHTRRVSSHWNMAVQGDLVKDNGYREQEYSNRFHLLLMNKWHDIAQAPGLQVKFNVQLLGEKSAVFVFWKNYPYYAFQPGLNSLSRQTLYYLFADPSVRYMSPKGNIFNFQNRLNWQNTQSSKGISGYSLQYWGEFTWTRRIKPWVDIIAGANYQYSYSEPLNNIYGKASGQQAAPFAIATFHFLKYKRDPSGYRITMTAGVRFQFEKVRGDTTQTDSVYRPVNLITMKQPIAGVTVNYHALPFTYIRASISQGARTASLNERFSNISLGGLKTEPAPDIKAETGYSTEIGMTQYFGVKRGRSSLTGYVDVAGFIMHFNNMIEFLIDIPKSSLTDLSFKAQNLTDVYIYGGEANLGFKYEYDKFRLSGNAGITAIDPVNYGGLKQLDGDAATVLVLNPPVNSKNPNFYKYIYDIPYTLKYRSKYTSTESLTMGGGIFNFTVNYRYLSRMINVDKLLLFAIPGAYDFRKANPDGWNLLDFIVSVTIRGRHVISAHLFNALNTQYMILPGSIGEQRSAALQYKVSF
jgi:outer membrane receptor protein involved in Fe transport